MVKIPASTGFKVLLPVFTQLNDKDVPQPDRELPHLAADWAVQLVQCVVTHMDA
jgi:hypothetical protein